MKRSSTLLVLSLLAAGSVAAAPIVIDAREAFPIPTIDGGLGSATGVAHFPGEDKGIISPQAVGISDNVSYFPIVQLGGPDAGAIVGQMDVTNGTGFTLPYPFFRERVGAGAPVIYFADISKIMRRDGETLKILPTQNLFPVGYGQATTFEGTIRIPTLTGFNHDVGWGELSHLNDGSLGQKILEPAFAIIPGTGTPLESYSPPESGEVYAFPIKDPSSNSVWHGRYGQYDAGFDDLGTVPSSVWGTAPHILTSAGHVYYFARGTDAGVFTVYDVSSTGVTPRGEFLVSVNGVVCDTTKSGCNGYPYLIADGFPGYPAGAFVVQGQSHNLSSRRMLLLVGLDDLSSALGLEFDGGTLPTGIISGGGGGSGPDAGGGNDAGGGGGGGGSGNGGGSPLGPGVGVHSEGSCSTSAAVPELWLLLATVAGLSVRRRKTG